MKVLVIGGVAAGTKAAAKLKRENRAIQVKLLSRSPDISYAGCGLPYYLGGVIPNREDLIVNTPESFSALTGVEVVTGCEATALDANAKQITAVQNGVSFTESYDKLILAVGASPLVPDLPGVHLPEVFALRTPADAEHLRETCKNCRQAVIVGASWIGLEAAENLSHAGISVTVLDAAPQILPGAFDPEMADWAKRKLKENGIRVMTNSPLVSISGKNHVEAVVTKNGTFPADLVLLALGTRPATGFLQNSGLELDRGLIVVDAQQKTNLPDVYAAGDCALVRNAFTKQAQWSAMGSTANLTGRVLAQVAAGKDVSYGGCLGTGVAKLLPGLNAGRTGLLESQARDQGYDPVTAVCVLEDKPKYYPEASFFLIKILADRSSHKLLGVQVFGGGAVDKIVDIAVLGLYNGLALEDFNTLDFAYAPPFSTAIHPFVQACYVLENKLAGTLETFTPAEYAAGKANGYQVLDVQPAPSIPGARWVDLPQVNAPLDSLDKDAKLLLVCSRGRRGYFLQNRLKHLGYTNTRVLEGGVFVNTVKVSAGTLSPEEIKRVKGLGCLQDKRFPDRFNVRIITRNGKLTAAEQRAVAEAAERFGSGEVTMTTRLTLEIQAVPYQNLETLMDFLHNAGLETGGTGSKVRPVVSCKGTTCQYGLCDTFSLSQKLHERFYVGYHQVALPHKFKLAVSGCPNNCVKSNLNDVGIMGQRLPEVDLSKCKGCKVCQVEKACPIHIAKLADGKIFLDPNECNHCGRCVSKCPFGAISESTYGYKVFIGGRWGKKVAAGQPLSKLFTSEEEVLDLVEKIILFYRDEGISGERFADTIARLGFDYVEDKLLHGTLDKKAVMEKNVIGGATC